VAGGQLPTHVLGKARPKFLHEVWAITISVIPVSKYVHILKDERDEQ
jgi:hypothetical protein